MTRKHKHHNRQNPEPEPAPAEAAVADGAPVEATDAPEPNGPDGAPAALALPVGEDAEVSEAVDDGADADDETDEGEEEKEANDETPVPFDRVGYIAVKAADVPVNLADLVGGETADEIDASVALLAEAARRIRQAAPIGSYANPLRPTAPPPDALSAEDKIRLAYGRNN